MTSIDVSSTYQHKVLLLVQRDALLHLPCRRNPDLLHPLPRTHGIRRIPLSVSETSTRLSYQHRIEGNASASEVGSSHLSSCSQCHASTTRAKRYQPVAQILAGSETCIFVQEYSAIYQDRCCLFKTYRIANCGWEGEYTSRIPNRAIPTLKGCNPSETNISPSVCYLTLSTLHTQSIAYHSSSMIG